MFVRRRRVNKPALVMAVPSVFLLLVSIFGFSSPVKALTPVFESTAAAKVTLGSLASRTQCAALSRAGIGPYTMTGTDATSNSSYSYVTDKNYASGTAQFYEGQESPNQSLSYTTSTGQTYSGRNGVIKLVSQGYISYSNTCNNHSTYGSAFGPEIWSEPFPATANQSISFDWAAAGGYDDYEAYGYLVKVSASGNTYDYGSSANSTLVSYGRGQNQSWVTSTGIVPSTGYYRFRFVNGSYDATGGQALGATMYIDSAISVASANTITFAQPSDIVTSSSNQTFTVSATATSGLSVTFTSSTTGKCTVGSSTDSSGTSTATVTVLASQTGTCTISTNSSSNNSYVAAATVSQSFTLLAGSTAPTTSGGTSMSGTVAYGETLTAVDGTWGDGGSAVTATTYQWQSCTPSSCTWANISSATSSTYVISSDDVAKQIRVAVTKTNSIGSLTANSAASITVPAPTSVIVANLSDTSDSGSLRWAITTANASATINTITFASGNTGTITLTSALPAISDNLTITGAGLTSTIIDGNNLYRPFNISSGKSLTISDMTLKKGQATNGGLVNNGAGTFSATDVRFTGMTAGSAVFNNGGGSVSTLTDTTFDYLYVGIAGDYGSTPSALSQTDSDYTNRTYVYDSVFSNNTYGISGERFFKINNTQFISNTQVGAELGGLNRQQVTNSTFTSNGIGVYFSSWIPTGWAVGAGNQTVSGNTFNGNTTAIQFANNWNTGSSMYNGVSANSFSTATGNTFGASTSNATTFSGSGYVESGNTITAAYLNAVTNLTAVANVDGSVDLDWDASAASNTAIYAYSVSFYDLTVIGGATSGGWGVWTNQGTNYSLSTGMFSGINPVTTGYGPVRFGIKAGNQSCFSNQGVGSCVYGPEVTVDATVIDPTPVTTTTTTATTVPVYVPPVVVIPPVDTGTTSTSVVPVVVTPPDGTTVPLPQYPEPETESTTVTLPVGTLPGIVLPTITVPVTTVIVPVTTVTVPTAFPNVIGLPSDFNKLPSNATSTQIGAVIEEVNFTEVTDKTFGKTVDAVFDNINKPEDVANVIGAFLEADVSSKQLDAVLDKVFDGPMTANETTKILEGLLDGPVTATQLETIMDKVFEDISDTKNTIAVLGALLDGPLSKQELGSVMEAVFSEEATVTQMSAVVGDLLNQKLDVKELDAVFEAAFDGDLSDKETIDLIVDVLAENLTSEALGSALGAVFDDEVSNEVLVETFTAVLGTELDKESVGVIVNVLESESISEAQVATVVTLIIEQEGGVDSEQATELATSPKVLESIDGEQAASVFNAIVVAEVSEEAGAAISEALTEAPTDVKESFEEEINVFAGVFDTYTAIGSSIDVGTRRSVIAVNLVTSTVALAAAAGGIPTPGPSAPSAPRQDVAARREEEETEEGGAIEGESPDWIKQISIYKYEDGVRVMDWKNFARKFVYGVMASGFTLAGATVMYFTLSGFTQKIALWGTLLAFTASMYLHMKEPDEG